jgi:hypothetical protein
MLADPYTCTHICIGLPPYIPTPTTHRLQDLHLHLQCRLVVGIQFGLVNDLHRPLLAVRQGCGTLHRGEATPATTNKPGKNTYAHIHIHIHIHTAAASQPRRPRASGRAWGVLCCDHCVLEGGGCRLYGDHGARKEGCACQKKQVPALNGSQTVTTLAKAARVNPQRAPTLQPTEGTGHQVVARECGKERGAVRLRHAGDKVPHNPLSPHSR